MATDSSLGKAARAWCFPETSAKVMDPELAEAFAEIFDGNDPGTQLFRDELSSLLNKCSRENGSNTPDWILANYMTSCLEAFEIASNRRDQWYGIDPCPGKI